MKEHTPEAQQAEKNAMIRPGESTRADARAALGVPRLENDLWRAELYRVDDKHIEVMGPLLPLPMPAIVLSENRHTYILVTYDSTDRVAELSSGVNYDGALARKGSFWLMLRAGDLTFTIDLERREQVLLADSSRVSGYLAARSRSDGCTLVVACLQDEDCPDKVTVDDGESFDTSAITLACATAGSCPRGFVQIARYIPAATDINVHLIVSVPLLHAISLPRGQHRLRMSTWLRDGRGEAAFECTAGQVIYGSVNSHPGGATSWWSGKVDLRSTATLSPLAPEGLDARSLMLYRDGRWLVDH